MEKRKEPVNGNATGSRPTSAIAAEHNQERIQTGIAGLDDILNGGLPQGHLFLVEGDPEQGKQRSRCSSCWKVCGGGKA